jgi:hypothetical protein
VFFALCRESDFVFRAFCFESFAFESFDFESFDFESFAFFAGVFWFVFAGDFWEDCLDLSAVLLFESFFACDFEFAEELVLPFLSVVFFGVGVAFACDFLLGVGAGLAFFFAGVAFVFAEFLVCALSTESAKSNAKKMKKAIGNTTYRRGNFVVNLNISLSKQ